MAKASMLADLIPALEERFKLVPEEKRVELSGELNLTVMEWVALQERKSLAQASGLISFETAMWIYQQLGRSVDDFNNQSLAVKYLVAGVFKQLIARGA